MQISEIIERIKAYSRGIGFDGRPIQDDTTRDKVLYGSTDKECTGIVTCIWASTDVIRKAEQDHANFIIPHEALFWNHGDHTDWLQDNEIFQKKKKLLDGTDITVWRDHDYIHSGVPINGGKYVDGIFWGLMKKLNWNDRLVKTINPTPGKMPTIMFKEPVKASELALELVKKLGLNGIRIIGDPNTMVTTAKAAPHIIGGPDNSVTADTDRHQIDCLLTAELTDFTVSEYIRDSAMLGRPRCIITIGHFNMEEPGMEYMPLWLPEAIGTTDIPIYFETAGDPFQYVTVNTLNQ